MTNQPYQGLDPIALRTRSFEDLRASIRGLPDHKGTKPSPVRATLPLTNALTTVIVESYKGKETGFTIFLEIVDAQGALRIVLPDRVAQTIYRQRQSLTDRSTPESRARAAKSRQHTRRRKEREARRAAYAARNGARVT